MSYSHHAVLALFFVLIGCSVGSFLNVCAYRIPLGMSLRRPRSRCPRCLAAICACYNIPVLGWLMLRGRCRNCGGAIALRYPGVELLTGLSFGGVYLAWVASAPADLWEQSGTLGVLIRLLLLWSLIGIALVGALVFYDSLGRFHRDQSPLFPRASDLRTGARSTERADGGALDGVLAPRISVAGTQPDSETTPGGCAGTQPDSGDDCGNSAEPAREGRSVPGSGRAIARGRAGARSVSALGTDDVRST
jgi:hypothetical protein